MRFAKGFALTACAVLAFFMTPNGGYSQPDSSVAVTTSTTVQPTTTTSTTVAPRPTTTEASRSYVRKTVPPPVHNYGASILDRIGMCESHDNYSAQNAHSTASGKYQVLDSTWGGYGGYRRAKDAPPDVQEAQAHAMFAQEGPGPWAASRACWG